MLLLVLDMPFWVLICKYNILFRNWSKSAFAISSASLCTYVCYFKIGYTVLKKVISYHTHTHLVSAPILIKPCKFTCIFWWHYTPVTKVLGYKLYCGKLSWDKVSGDKLFHDPSLCTWFQVTAKFLISILHFFFWLRLHFITW